MKAMQSSPMSQESHFNHGNDQYHGYNLDHGSYHPTIQPSLPQMVEELLASAKYATFSAILPFVSKCLHVLQLLCLAVHDSPSTCTRISNTTSLKSSVDFRGMVFEGHSWR